MSTSGKTNDYYKLGSVVDQWIIDNSLHNGWFAKGLSWAKYGLRELRLDCAQDVKTVLLDVTDRKTAKLPDGFVKYTKIGAPLGQYVLTLSLNDELNTLPRTTSSQSVAGLLSQHLPNGLNFGQYEGYTFFNFNGGSLFGIGGGLPSKGYFKVHNNGTCKELLLDYDYSLPQVYVEYITDGLDPCTETIVHPFEVDYIIKFCDLKYEKKNNPKATNYSINEAERDLFWAEKKVRARNNPLTPQDVINISRAEIRLTPHI
jgi:hypothetical protein